MVELRGRQFKSAHPDHYVNRQIRDRATNHAQMPKRQDKNQPAFELPGIVQEFLTEYRDTPKTHAYYHDQLGRAFLNFVEANGYASPADVTPQAVREYLDTERLGTYQRGHNVRKRKPETIHHRYRALARFFNWCIDQGYATENPCARVRAPQVPRQTEGGFSREEISLLLKESRRAFGWLGYRDHAIVMLMLDTGCRAGGLLTMTDASIDWTRKRLLLVEKGRKSRYVPLGAATIAALKDYMRERPKLGYDAFWLTFRKNALKASSLAAMLHNLGSYAGVEDVHPHRFRHTYASLHYEEHRDMLALRNLLGHSKIETTERYLRSLGYAYGTGDEYSTPSSWIS